MFLKEYALRRYGPLPDSGKQELGVFNLFFGANEDGKTLTIDALLKMLFGKAAQRSFQAIKRVEEQPDGYLILQLEGSQDVKLPEAGSLPDLLEISPAEFANIFIIRDSNLAIANEDQFYRGVTNRLTGMRSEEINLIINELRELGKITSTGDYKNTAPDKLKEGLSKAHVLLEKGEQLAAKMLDEGYAGFEEELAALNREREECREQLKLQREAAGREKYETGFNALNSLKRALRDKEQLSLVTEDLHNDWRNAESKFGHISDERKRLEDDLKESREFLENARSEMLSAKAAFREAEQEQKKVAATIENGLVEYNRQEASFCRWESIVEKSTLSRFIGAGFLAFILTLAGSIFRPAWWTFMLLGLAVVVVLFTTTVYLIFIEKKSKLNQAEATLLARAEGLNLNAGDIPALRRNFGLLEIKVNAAAAHLNEAENSLEWRQIEFNRIKKELEARDKQLAQIRSDLAGFQQQTGAEKLEEATGIIKRQQELQREIEKGAGILESHFGKGDQPGLMAEMKGYWQSQIDSLENYKGAAPGVVYDRKAVAELNERLSSLEQETVTLKELLNERRDEMRTIEKELLEIFSTEDPEDLRCETTADLKMMLKKLAEWIAACEDHRGAALAAISLFEKIEQEEEEKVSELFSGQSPVDSYFSQITGGLYENVTYDPDNNTVNIIRKDGHHFTADQLSGGAYDQLYFAIRLALGEKLLQGDKGFFILDDPFIKSDPERLQILLSMLFSIVADGWQILYFSSKGEIRQALEDKIAAGEVRQISFNPGGVHN